ncbi:MAG: hypothetical protein FJY91_02060 [Candidatus Harrisonbacteria bacterium]|nr:hypothetical protein [Candidatus Harrisonbacteria bacterium]
MSIRQFTTNILKQTLLVLGCLLVFSGSTFAAPGDEGLLPSNPFYFFKEWGRGIRRATTFSDEKRNLLELSILRDKEAEVTKLSGIMSEGSEAVGVAVRQYADQFRAFQPKFAALKQRSYSPAIQAKALDLSYSNVDVFSNLPLGEVVLKEKQALLKAIFDLGTTGETVREKYRVFFLEEANPVLAVTAFNFFIDAAIQPGLSSADQYELLRLSEEMLSYLNRALKIAREEQNLFLSANLDPLLKLQALVAIRARVSEAERATFDSLNLEIIKMIGAPIEIKKVELRAVRFSREMLKVAEKWDTEGAMKKNIDQVQFFLDQADLFLKNNQPEQALFEANRAVAVLFQTLLFLTTPNNSERVYIKEFERLKIENPDQRERIENILEVVKDRKLTFPDVRVEAWLFDSF